MNGKQITYPVQDRWSFFWLGIGLLLAIPYKVPLVSWVAVIFLLRFMRTQKPWRGFLILCLGMFVPYGIIMYTGGFIDVLNLKPLPVFLVAVAMTAVISSLSLLVDRLLVPRLRGFTATLVLPLAATVVDFVNVRSSASGSFMDSAYFQYGDFALMQIVSITGIWGIIFLTNWLSAVVNYAWEHRFAWSEIRRGVFVYGAIMAMVMIYGSVRLAYAPEATRTVRIHGFSALADFRSTAIQKFNALQSKDWQAYRQYSKELQDLYLAGTIREAQSGAQIVHWPEMAFMIAKEDEAAFLERAGQVARDQNIYIVMAYGAVPQEGKWDNKVVIMDSSGKVVLEHKKYALTEQEGTAGGDSILRTVQTPYGVLSAIVCGDADHEEIVAQAGRNGTDILFSPSLEMREVDPMRAHMVTYRAIENGVTQVRQALTGRSIVVDPYGRTVASMDHFITTDRVMVAAVPIQQTFTLYSYAPDLFAWLAIAGLAALVVVAVIQTRKARVSVHVV